MKNISTQVHLTDFSGLPVENVHRFAHQAMATIFEIYIFHEDLYYAGQTAAEAFLFLDKLENDLSRFIENSDISRIRIAKPYEPVGLGIHTFECLKNCIKLHEKTGSVFDITIGHLMNIWLNKNKELRDPTLEEIEYARRKTGLQHLVLDEEQHTAIVLEAPLALDLGGYGKGYAIDKMAEFLLDWEVNRALIHGGNSSVLALNPPNGLEGWPVTIHAPHSGGSLRWLNLNNNAISGSGIHKGQHIIDPRIGKPIKGNRAAWASALDAATTDGLSTAFMIMTKEEVKRYCQENNDISAAVCDNLEEDKSGKNSIIWFGEWSSLRKNN